MAKKIAVSGVIGWDDQATAEYLDEQLKAANGDDVELHISSPGGLVGAGLRMFNLVRNYPGKTKAVLSGYAMSMASYIPQACDEVVAEDNAVYMIHNARGWTAGDHKEILKYGNYVKGLSGISAREFVKATAKRGKAKSLEEITQMMDDETFLFGGDMVEQGFVDSLIETGNNDDQETALFTAKAAFSEAMAKLAGDPGRVKADLQLAMQMWAPEQPVQQVSPPAAPAAGNNKQEVQQIMGLKELLAANPAAQAEYDQAIASAKAAGVAEMQDTVKACAPFLANANYPKQVGEMAVKVMTGEQSKANLDMIVATADMMKEMGAQAPATPAAPAGQQVLTPAAPVGIITDDAGLDTVVAELKGGA